MFSGYAACPWILYKIIGCGCHSSTVHTLAVTKGPLRPIMCGIPNASRIGPSKGSIAYDITRLPVLGKGLSVKYPSSRRAEFEVHNQM